MNSTIESRISVEARPLSPIEFKKDNRVMSSSDSGESGGGGSCGSSACSSPSSYAPIDARVNRVK